MPTFQKHQSLLILIVIVNITLPLNVIGLKDHVFSTNLLLHVIGQLDKPITFNTAF